MLRYALYIKKCRKNTSKAWYYSERELNLQVYSHRNAHTFSQVRLLPWQIPTSAHSLITKSLEKLYFCYNSLQECQCFRQPCHIWRFIELSIQSIRTRFHGKQRVPPHSYGMCCHQILLRRCILPRMTRSASQIQFHVSYPSHSKGNSNQSRKQIHAIPLSSKTDTSKLKFFDTVSQTFRSYGFIKDF